MRHFASGFHSYLLDRSRIVRLSSIPNWAKASVVAVESLSCPVPTSHSSFLPHFTPVTYVFLLWGMGSTSLVSVLGSGASPGAAQRMSCRKSSSQPLQPRSWSSPSTDGLFEGFSYSTLPSPWACNSHWLHNWSKFLSTFTRKAKPLSCLTKLCSTVWKGLSFSMKQLQHLGGFQWWAKLYVFPTSALRNSRSLSWNVKIK